MLEISKSRDILINTINSAKEFIWIITFQFSDSNIIELLSSKQKSGVDVRIVTLPIDSYNNANERDRLSNLHSKIKHIDYCRWEIGDPSLTNSSLSGEQSGGGGDKWYSLHGKLVITEQSVLVLTANLNLSDDWDVFYSIDSKSLIENTKQKFNEFVEKFCKPIKSLNDVQGYFFYSLSDDLQKQFISESRRLVPYYTRSQVQENVDYKNGLYFSPFDSTARNVLYQIIDNAETFLGISGETITDPDLVLKLIQKKYEMPDIKIFIVVGSTPPRDPNKKSALLENIIKLGSFDITFNVIDDYHAKIWVSDKLLVVGSANLNPMNLGIEKPKGHWKANTETLFISSEPTEISNAKNEFNKIIKISHSAISLSLSKAEKDIQSTLKALKIKSKPETRKVLGYVSVYLSQSRLTDLNRILLLATKIQKIEKTKLLTPLHAVCGAILWKLEKTSSSIENLEKDVESITGQTKDLFNAAIDHLNINLKIIRISTEKIVSLDIQGLLTK